MATKTEKNVKKKIQQIVAASGKLRTYKIKKWICKMDLQNGFTFHCCVYFWMDRKTKTTTIMTTRRKKVGLGLHASHLLGHYFENCETGPKQTRMQQKASQQRKSFSSLFFVIVERVKFLYLGELSQSTKEI